MTFLRRLQDFIRRQPRAPGAHIVVQVVNDGDGMDYVVEEYRGDTRLSRHALSDVEPAAQRVRALLSMQQPKVEFIQIGGETTWSVADKSNPLSLADSRAA
jgi:hypothetical protein